MAVARAAGCDAVHPGYGFLAENAAFARACGEASITFIGPSPEAMEQLGSKTAARHVARATGVPTVPGTLDPIENANAALAASKPIGFPVVLKAVAGGGGKGMRLVENEAAISSAWRDASSEAQNAFGDGRLYIEKYLLRPRHIEIQILGDHHGNIVYLGERECSVQRRYQKVIEEAPSPVMTPELRRAMGESAVKLARAGKYANAGHRRISRGREAELLFPRDEHPPPGGAPGDRNGDRARSREAADSRSRRGSDCRWLNNYIALRGHAIECRIYAEDPDNNFFPSPGKIIELGASRPDPESGSTTASTPAGRCQTNTILC